MSRIKRIFRGFMAIKSVIIGGLILVVWIRSYFAADTIVRGDERQSINVISAAGRVMVRYIHDGQPTRLRASWRWVQSAEPLETLRGMPKAEGPWGRLGFGFNKEQFSEPQPGVRVDIVMPHWLMFLLAIPSAVLWMIRGLRAPPSTGDFAWCPRCCAQMRASSQRCPRCGGPVAVSAFGAPSLSRR